MPAATTAPSSGPSGPAAARSSTSPHNCSAKWQRLFFLLQTTVVMESAWLWNHGRRHTEKLRRGEGSLTKSRQPMLIIMKEKLIWILAMKQCNALAKYHSQGKLLLLKCRV